MSDRLLKDWKTPIPISDFCEFVAKPIAVERNKRNFFETKDSTSLTGHRLRARVRMTFAGLPTKNHALYLPDEMYKGLKSWTSPYPKPVQKHHFDHEDPVGRIIDARYVDTTAEAAQLDSRVVHAMAAFRDKKAKPQARLASVPIFQELASTQSNYRGVGHIEGLWDISDPDAIRKLLDGRLLTVSTSFVPEGAYCSACARDGELVDWRHEYCDHERGDIVDGFRVVAIPFGHDNSEASFVNDPAAVLAQVLEVGENISFADAVKDIKYSTPYELISDAVIVVDGKGFRFSDSTPVLVPENLAKTEKTPTEKDASVIGSNEQCGDSYPQRNIMRFADLIKDTGSNYQKIAEHLAEGSARLTGALLVDLDDSVFAGPNRTFPIRDAAHCEAIKSLLETIEDSEAKADLLEIVDAAIKKFNAAEDVKGEEDTAEALEASEEEPTQDANDESREADSVLITAEELAFLKEAAAKAGDLEASRDMLKQRIAVLQTDIAQLEAANSVLLNAQKEMLATQLVDAQIAKGFRVTDKREQVAKLMKRGIDSLKDSLDDLSDQAETGMARKPSGKKVDNPVSDASNSERAEPGSATDSVADLNEYTTIFNEYYRLSYGPGGQREADAYLNSQKRMGYLPSHVNP